MQAFPPTPSRRVIATTSYAAAAASSTITASVGAEEPVRSDQRKSPPIARRIAGATVSRTRSPFLFARAASVGAAGSVTRLLAHEAAEAAHARPVLGQHRLELLLAEVGPGRLDGHELRVRLLPEEEVADALLARRPHEEVERRHLPLVEPRLD